MKKFLSLALATLLVLLALASCKHTGDGKDTPSGSGIPDTPPSTPIDSPEGTPGETDPVTPPEITFTDCDETVYVVNTESGLKLRTSPVFDDTDANVGAYADPGKELRRIGYHETWSKVVFEGEEYFASSKFLSTEKPAEPEVITFQDVSEMVYIFTGYEDGVAKVYPEPSRDSQYITLPEGTVLKRTGIAFDDAEGNGWSRVEYDGNTHYVRNSVVSPESVDVTLGEITFKVIKSWTKTEYAGLTMFIDEATGNNINCQITAKTSEFNNITAKEFEDMMKPTLEASNIAISDTVVDSTTNANGITVFKFSYIAKTTVEGTEISMRQTLCAATVGNSTYVITVTEVTPEVAIARLVIETMVKATPAA